MRSRLKFLAASIPEKPNSFPVKGEVFTSRLRIFTSWVWRMASIGDSRTARRAGIQAEITAVIRPMPAAASSAHRFSTNRISTAPPLSPPGRKPKLPRRQYRVMPMPRQPTSSPSGIPTAHSTSASYRTLPRICFFVAPTDFRMPNWRVRSATEMEKEL